MILTGGCLGAFLLYAFVFTFVFTPDHLPRFKLYIVALACALFSGLFASLFLGSLGVSQTLAQTRAVENDGQRHRRVRDDGLCLGLVSRAVFTHGAG